jgi:magnesium transporter
MKNMTVYASIVLPLNLIAGIMGMNVLVPGQNVESLVPFFVVMFAMFCSAGLVYLFLKIKKVV